jgi:flagellar motor switch protein FliN/FliY
MSDGALSQEEIDSLLAGLDGGSSGQAGPAPRSGSALSPQELQAFKAILDAMTGSQSQNLSMITGLPVTVQGPVVDSTTRDGFLKDVPEEVLSVSVPFTGSIPGDHCFVMSKETAIRIASLANKDETLSEIDDMSVSAVQECVSTLTGTQITVISEKTGNRSITAGVAEGSFGPKAMVKVPSGEFLRATYQLQIGDGKPERLVELFALSFVKDLLVASGSSPSVQTASAPQAAPAAPQFGASAGMQGFGPAQGYGAAFPQGQASMAPPQAMQGYGGAAYPMGGYMGPGMNPPNVQPVQFASLGVQQSVPESGNIGLIMDVLMEMTVELGRTKKLIKDILGMGEGTIIELDKLAGEPVDILVNKKLIAKGEVVVIDENFGVRVTEIVSPMERMSDLS